MIRPGGELPWGKDALRDLRDLAIDRLPEHLTIALREQRDAQHHAAEQLVELLKDPAALSDEDAQQACEHAALLYGQWSPAHLEVQRTIRAARELAAAQDPDAA